ncbi:SapC family protein [Sphingomonas cavernae]|uniref:Peptide ABC transporter permease n=1 Tax=Sphingomonas cavernae TaxID=2320861 RepID=A0A418WLI9_9SPHN|nr:SapC family protein [Sphingomonas cavernae]RJF90832.1 peptide ABC transporter permease [Sphingomonas cavernae]
MTNIVLLNNVDHHGLRVVTRHAAQFGDSVNQMLIFPTEYDEVQREYPILFRKDANGEFQSVALLGLERDENLFLGEHGWEGRYVPAVQQRGPFSIALPAGDDAGRAEPMIHVDLDDPRISDKSGEPLFLPHGGNAPQLERVAAALRTIYSGLEVSKPMFAAFEEAGLIEPVLLEIKLSDAEQYNVSNYYTIGEDRLAALDAAWLDRLHRGGFLRSAFSVVSSLRNVSRLIDIKNRKRGISAPPVAA